MVVRIRRRDTVYRYNSGALRRGVDPRTSFQGLKLGCAGAAWCGRLGSGLGRMFMTIVTGSMRSLALA